LKIIGYSDQLSVPPGATLEFKVSTELPAYSADLIRFTRALPVLDPGQDRLIAAPFAGSYRGRVQAIGIGSYISVDPWPALSFDDGLTVQLWLQPSRLPASQEQGVLSCHPTAGNAGFWIGLDPVGHAVLRITDQEGLSWKRSMRGQS
jgi:N,N-dimethylformamidase